MNFITVGKVLGATIIINPGDSIQTKCVNAAIAGDTCTINGGVYSERVTVGKPINLVCSSSCQLTQGIVVNSGVTLRGFEIINREVKLAGSNIVIENNYIHDQYTDGNYNNVYGISGGIELIDQPNSTNVTIKNNKIIRAINSCIVVNGIRYTIEGNECGFTKQPSSGDADCFRAFGTGHKFLRNNCHDLWFKQPGLNYAAGDYVSNGHPDCFQTWQWASQGGALRDSLFEGNFCDVPDVDPEQNISNKSFSMSGDASRYCGNNIYRYNVLHTNFIALNTYCENLTFVYNTFVGETTHNGKLKFQLSRGTNTVQNNIFVNLSTVPIEGLDAASRSTIVAGNNFFWRNAATSLSSAAIAGDVVGKDPLFVDMAGKDYHLRPGSPACGFGAYECGTQTETKIPTQPLPTTIKVSGDANGDGRADLLDFAVWKKEYLGQLSTKAADFDGSGSVNLVDFSMWKKGYLGL